MSRMKAILLCALLAIVGSTTAQTVKMSAEGEMTDVGVTVYVADKTADLTLSLENSMEIAGWQMYLYLPDGIEIAFEEVDGERSYDVVLSSRHKSSHVCTVTETADGGWLIQGYNPSKPTAINGNSGDLVTITLQAANNYSGWHTATIKGVAVAEMNSKQTDMVGEVIFLITEQTTDINAVTIDQPDNPLYNLGGQRVEHPSKGIYVRNGKKEVRRKAF